MICNDEKHNSIVCAAVHEFAEKGFMATTMEGIAKQASVSKRTLYKHYKDKQQLFDAVVELLIAQFKVLESIEYDVEQAFVPQLAEIARQAIALNSDEHFIGLSRMVIIEAMRCEHAARYLNERFGECEQGMMRWFDSAKASGALGKADQTFIAAVFFGTIKKVSFWEQAIKWQPQLTTAEAEQLIEQLCCLINSYIEQQKA